MCTNLPAPLARITMQGFQSYFSLHCWAWKTITITKACVPSFSSSCLDSGGSRLVQLLTSWPLFRGTRLRIITAHLHRMESLSLCIHVLDANATLCTLRHHAPVLHSLELLLCDTAPNLTKVALENPRLPARALPFQLCNTSRLDVDAAAPRPQFPQSLMSSPTFASRLLTRLQCWATPGTEMPSLGLGSRL